MYSMDESDITFHGVSSGSRLMSESPLVQSSSIPTSDTGPGGADLSLSELSLSDRAGIYQQPFSLLARVQAEPSAPTHGAEEQPDDHDVGGSNENEMGDDDTRGQRNAVRTREEKLRNDVFILKKLNAAFSAFNEALGDTKSANERIAAQLEQTDALLNKYIKILSKSEECAKLIFNEDWQGAEADEEIMQQEIRAAQEKAQQEAEERARAARLEQERLQREAAEKQARVERERAERDRQERLAARGGVRGVRGTRASMRRGTSRTAPVTSGMSRGSRSATTDSALSIPGGPSMRRITPAGSSVSTRGTTRKS